MIEGKILTLWLIRAAAVLYVAAVALWLARRDRGARLAWTAACLLFVTHVAFAFQFFHHWSHTAAYEATARVSGFGPGIFFDYAFLAVWVSDTVWWWRGLDVYRARARRVATSVHGFLAFMFFNATVIFATGAVRWFGIAATLLLGALWLRRFRETARTPTAPHTPPRA